MANEENPVTKNLLLLVEDDLGLQKQLKWSFDDLEVVVAGDREAALAAVRRYEPPVVTLDLGLPPDADGANEGLATLEQLTPEVYTDLNHRANIWAKAFEKIPGLHAPHIGSLIWPLFQEGVRRSDGVKTESITHFNKLHKLLLEQGVYLPPSGYEVAFLSTAHDDKALDYFEQAIALVAVEMKEN